MDDTDWGGPETVTLKNPPPGNYVYWVHDYSNGGPPAVLGQVGRGGPGPVRRPSGAGEFRPPEEVEARDWRPFKHIEVGREGVPTLVRFTEDEIAEGADLAVPADLQPPESAPATPPAPGEPASPSRFPSPILYLLLFIVFVLFAKARRRRRG